MRDVAIDHRFVDTEAATMQQPNGVIIDARSVKRLLKQLDDRLILVVNADHRGILVADEKLDHPILPGLKAG